MMYAMDLPPGLLVRPLAMDDVLPVANLRRAGEVHDVGEALIDDEDIIGDWRRPGFNLESQSIGVLDGQRLVGYAEVFKGRNANATVHPDHRNRGIGAALSGWAQERARADGGTCVGQTVPSGGDAERLLETLGYHERWTTWVLELPQGSVVEPQHLEPGYGIREIHPGDERAAYQLIENAFNEWPGRQPTTFDDWAAASVLRPGFEPWQLRLLCDPAGTPVGVSFLIISGGCGFVDKLAVRADQRGHGLARALVADSFEVARSRGARRCEVSTDSRTGALGLYQSVGMQVTMTWRHLAIALG
jgi:GNAT superfamily N-acetyltransferase